MLMLLLCDLGHSVSVASNLEQAYAKMAEERPELIICDFNLSGGESGADVWASLPDLAPQAKMIMMSGYSAETIGASCAGSDAMELYRYMEKPIDFDALSAAIESMASR
jgi:DNA-binding NtrC family response regulator